MAHVMIGEGVSAIEMNPNTAIDVASSSSSLSHPKVMAIQATTNALKRPSSRNSTGKSPTADVAKRQKLDSERAGGSRSATPTGEITFDVLKKTLRKPMSSKKLIKKLGDKFPHMSTADVTREVQDILQYLK